MNNTYSMQIKTPTALRDSATEPRTPTDGVASQGVPRRQVQTAFALFCAIALWLNAPALRDSLALKPYGVARDIWLSVFNPLADFAEWTRLGKLRIYLDSILSAD